MKKRVMCSLVLLALWVPGIICAEDVTYEDSTYGELFFPTPADTRSRDASILHPREWYVLEKIPTGKGLAIGVFLFEEGMPIEHIQSKFGKPQETITVEVEGYDGTILVYPHHHFFFSKAGNLQTIKKRKL